MKRFLAIMLAVFMLVPLFVFSVSAEETEAKCTYKRTNVASLATITHNSGFWGVDTQWLVDGDGSKGTAAGSDLRETVFTFTFAEATLFDEIAMVVNAKGSLPSSWQGFDEQSNNDYPITVKLYNGETEVYSFGPIQTADRTTLSTSEDPNFEPVSATKIVITLQNNNANHLAALWEVEAYSGSSGKHAWQTVETVASDCETAGHVDYVCSCGATKTEELPLSETHAWDDGTVKTPATASTEGVKEYTCTVCGDKREVAIPATEHNAFDEGVVTAPTCTEAGYTTYTCTHCNTYTYKDNYVDALGHELDEGTPIVRQTFTTEGKTKYSCVRFDDCGYFEEVTIPAAWYRDSEFTIGAANATVTEEITGNPFSSSSTEVLFDGIIVTNPVNNPKETNYWKAPAGTDCSGKLTIEFDYEYCLTGAKFYIYGNSLGFTIEIFDAAGTSIYKTEKSNYAVSSALAEPIVVETEIMGQNAKKIVITSTNQHGKSPWVSEVEVTAHKCLYDEGDMSNVVEDAPTCKTTFDGTCWMCGVSRTGVVEYNHTFEKETGTEIDKIYTTNLDETTDYKDATCYTDGKGYKHCTVCDVDVDTKIKATGAHDFENGKIVYDEDAEPNCGKDGAGHIECATEGCPEILEKVFPATGNHSKWSWKILAGYEPDYTHTGLKGYICGVCGYQDEEKDTQEAPMEKLSCVSQKDWSIRYTDFVSPRASFKLSNTNLDKVKDEFDVKIFGVVTKGETIKEIQVYGEGATGNVASDGTFSLVVKDASYTDEYKFSVRVEVTCKADNTKNTFEITSKNITTAADGIVSVKDVASYYLTPAKVTFLDEEIKKFYESIVG